MDTLRLILLLLGALFIGALLLYYWVTSDNKTKLLKLFGRPKFSRANETEEILDEPPASHYDDQPDAEDIAALSELSLPVIEPHIDVDALGPMSALPQETAVSGETLMLALNIMARHGKRFLGADVLQALQQQGFIYGDMNLFHAFANENATGQPVFSVANTVEPGSFEIEQIEQLETPGLLLFMQLPGPLPGREAFERLLQTGRALTEQLDGVLCDESRSVLTLQTIGHIKEKIDAFYFKQKMSAQNQHRR